MARCPRCGSEAIEEINPNTYKCHECGYMIRNPDDLDLADQEYGYQNHYYMRETPIHDNY